MGKLHLFELRSGHILLDGVTIRGIRECEFSIKENDSLAELSLKMDVRTLGNEFATQFDGALNETGKIKYQGKCDACGIGITCEKEDVTNIQVGMNELGNFVECPICGEKIRVTEYTEQIQKRSIK